MENVLTERIAQLRLELKRKGSSNRSIEWVDKQKLPNIGETYPNEHVVVRRAYAIKAMLEALCDTSVTGNTNCFQIANGDLLAGNIPMGSNGLGKVFPTYLTDEELRIGSVTNKTEMALLGHNSINYEKLLKGGLREIIRFAESKLAPKMLKMSIKDAYDVNAFYKSVIISCNAVIDYSHRFSQLAKDMAYACTDAKRKAELLEISRICKKVPEHPADTFYEAMHSIWLMHCCLHSTMDFMSLGRLDQVLNPYLEKEPNKEFALELFQNFIIKAASRLNFTTEYLVEQDHMDYNAALGIHPYYLDQRAGLNNFLQNIIIGGKTPDSNDATNECTYLILDAFRGINLSTPGIYVRLHSQSPQRLVDEVARSLKETKNLPAILNDDVMIPAMYNALAGKETDKVRLAEYQRLANDYCVDGCWEPILNGVSEWTFGMINGLTVLECAMNRGAALNPNPELLRGQKLSIDTGVPSTYDEFKNAISKQLQFFIDQSAFAMCLYYMTTEFVVPTPLVSALFGTCLERGKDKSWGGAQYNIGGTIVGGVPDMVNTIAAIKTWVYDKKKYSITDVANAFKYNYKAPNKGDDKTQKLYNDIKVDINTNSPQWVNSNEVEPIAQFLTDEIYSAVSKSKQLAEKVFINKEGDEDKSVWALRAISGYYGKSMQYEIPDFELKFTAGLGTFEQYNWQGAGNAASAGRAFGAPLAPNFTPTTGTLHKPVSSLLASFAKLGLDRYAGGVITDVCVKEDENLADLLKLFVKEKGGMLTVTIASDSYQKIYDIAKEATESGNKEVANELLKYSDIVVRVGGWNAPFITLPLSHMENYVSRPVDLE